MFLTVERLSHALLGPLPVIFGQKNFRGCREQFLRRIQATWRDSTPLSALIGHWEWRLCNGKHSVISVPPEPIMPLVPRLSPWRWRCSVLEVSHVNLPVALERTSISVINLSADHPWIQIPGHIHEYILLERYDVFGLGYLVSSIPNGSLCCLRH